MADSIGRLALILSADSAALGRDLDRAGGMVDSFGGDVRRKMDKLGNELAKKQLLSTPFNVQRQAGLDLANDFAGQRLATLGAQARSSMVTPQFAQQMAAMQLAQEEAQQKQAKLLEAAKEKEMPTVKKAGRFEDLGFKLGSPFGGGTGQAMAKAGEWIDGVTGALTKFIPHAKVAAVAIGIATTAWATAIKLATVASPVLGERLERAWTDLQAVLGQRTIPILKITIDAVRLFADVMHTILPSGREFERAFAPVQSAIATLRDHLGGLAQMLRGLISGQIQMFAAQLNMLAAPFQALDNVTGSRAGTQFGSGLLAGLLGLPAGGGNLESSRNAAPRAAQFVGLEQLHEANLTTAFSTQGDAQRETADNTRTTNEILREVADSSAAIARGAAGGAMGEGVANAILGIIGF